MRLKSTAAILPLALGLAVFSVAIAEARPPAPGGGRPSGAAARPAGAASHARPSPHGDHAPASLPKPAEPPTPFSGGSTPDPAALKEKFGGLKEGANGAAPDEMKARFQEKAGAASPDEIKSKLDTKRAAFSKSEAQARMNRALLKVGVTPNPVAVAQTQQLAADLSIVYETASTNLEPADCEAFASDVSAAAADKTLSESEKALLTKDLVALYQKSGLTAEQLRAVQTDATVLMNTLGVSQEDIAAYAAQAELALSGTSTGSPPTGTTTTTVSTTVARPVAPPPVAAPLPAPRRPGFRRRGD